MTLLWFVVGVYLAASLLASVVVYGACVLASRQPTSMHHKYDLPSSEFLKRSKNTLRLGRTHVRPQVMARLWG